MFVEQSETARKEYDGRASLAEEIQLLERTGVFDDPVLNIFDDAKATYAAIRRAMRGETDYKARLGITTATRRFEPADARSVMTAQVFQVVAHQTNAATYKDGRPKIYRKAVSPVDNLPVESCDHTLDVGLGAMGVELKADGTIYDNSRQCLRHEAVSAAHLHDVVEDVQLRAGGNTIQGAHLHQHIARRWGQSTACLVAGLTSYADHELPEGLYRALEASALSPFIYEQATTSDTSIESVRNDIIKAFAASYRVFATANSSTDGYYRTFAELTHLKALDGNSNAKTPGVSDTKLIRAQTLLVMLRLMGDPLSNRYLETLAERGLNVADPADPLHTIPYHREVIARRSQVSAEEQQTMAQLVYEVFGVEAATTSLGYPITLSDETLLETAKGRKPLALGIQHTFILDPTNVKKMWNATTGYGAYQLGHDHNRVIGEYLKKQSGEYGIIEVDGVMHRLIQNGNRKSWMYALVDLSAQEIVRYMKFVDDEPTLFDTIRQSYPRPIDPQQIPEGYLVNPYDGISDEPGEIFDRISFLHNPVNLRRVKKVPVSWTGSKYHSHGLTFVPDTTSFRDIYSRIPVPPSFYTPVLIKPSMADFQVPVDMYDRPLHAVNIVSGAAPDLVMFRHK